jgi:hypothetical protein
MLFCTLSSASPSFCSNVSTQTGQQAAAAAAAFRASTTELSTLHSQHPAKLEQERTVVEAATQAAVQMKVWLQSRI